MPTETVSATPRAPREIPVRRLSFDFERVRRYWFGGDPFQSHLLHALSLTFPDGERFFMDAVRPYLDRVDSPALRHEISHFLAQEAAHGQAHEAFNEWVRSLGLDAASIVEEVRANLAVARTRPPKVQLAATCALEHFTAILAEVLFADEKLREQMDPEMRRLWLWHSIEETEHKAVAFDTFLAVGGTYRLRAIVMLFTSVSFLANVARFQARLSNSDPELHEPHSILRGWLRMWVSPGVLRPIVPAYLDYFRPSFHPWQRKPKGDYEAIRAAFMVPASKGAVR
jgi:predicted metal-dependent hydrolase